MQLFQIFGSFRHVVETNDPFGVAVAGDLGRDVGFDVNVLDTGGNAAAKQHQAFLFGLHPAPAVVSSSRGQHDRTGAIVNQPREADCPANVIQPQLDEFRSLLSEKLVFGNHPFVAGSTEGYANHGLLEDKDKVK